MRQSNMSGKRLMRSVQELSDEIERKRGRQSLEDDDDEEPVPPSQSQTVRSTAKSVVKKSQSFNAGDEAEAGIIEYIQMENFMCHSKLEFKLGSHVNFIIGNNGSGKSSVLTAIMVGLGGKATATDRGRSIKAFIKNGKKAAKTVIRLRNSGPNAFKRDIYGDSITVERRISSEGASCYKLKNNKLTVVSTKREELDGMLERFNIQVDNPISILNQEASRTFLMSRNPKDQYKFFMKATQLDQIKQDYFLAHEATEEAQQNLKDKEKLIQGLENTVEEWRRRYEAITVVDKLKERLEDRKKEMACALVLERRKDAESAAQELQTAEASIPNFLSKCEESEVKIKDKEAEQKQIEEGLKELAERAASLQNEHAAQKDNLNVARTSHRKSQEEVRILDKELRSLQTDKSQIVARIEELSKSGNDEYLLAVRERERKMATVTQRIEALKRDEDVAEAECGRSRDAVTEIRQRKEALHSDECGTRAAERKLTESIQQLVAARSNKLRVYGDFMPQVMQRINDAVKCKQFHETPRGPIGSLLSVKDPQWNLALENCLGAALLRSFAVTDYHDQKVLEQIFQSSCPQGFYPNIICGKFQHTPYNVPRNMNKHPTVLDILKIDDPVVYNCIVDQRSAEFVLLIKENKDALTFAETPAAQTYYESFTIKGDHVIAKPTLRFYSCNLKGTRYLTSDFEDNIRQNELELAQVKEKLKSFDGEKRGVMEELNQMNSELRRHEEALRKLSQSLTAANRDLKELANNEIPAPIDISTLEEEVRLLDNNMSAVEHRQIAATEKAREQQERMQAAEVKFKDMDKLLRNATRELDPYRENLSTVMEELNKAKEYKKHYQAKLKEFQASLVQIRKRCEQRQKEYEDDKRKVLEHFSELVETDKKPIEIENEIKALRVRIAAKEKSQGNSEMIAQTYKTKVEFLQKAKLQFNELNGFLEHLASTIEERQKFFKRIRDSTTFRVKICFMNHLSMRGFSGKLEISHRKELLEPIVTPAGRSGQDNTASPSLASTPDDDDIMDGRAGKSVGRGKKGELAQGGGRSSRTLSGGERSYSTCCLIMSLWDVMDVPFRCLDEFDVFMDMINRRVTTDMILQTAAEKRSNQFIILSPFHLCEMSISTALDVSIFQMKAPERSLTQSNSSAAAEEEEDEN